MEGNTDMLTLLDKITQPVFCVKEYEIVQVNTAARQLFLEPGMDIRPLLDGALEEYESFRDGCLYLTLHVSGQSISCCVQRMDGLDIFELDTGSDSHVLRTLALTSSELRRPLASALSGAEGLLKATEDPQARTQLAELNRNLYRMLRILGNMSDAEEFSVLSRQETVNIPEVMGDIFQKAADLLDSSGIILDYTGLSEPVYALADSTQLERAVLNILSNAAKFSPKGSHIQASLSRRGRVLRLTVQDCGSGIADTVMSSLFHRYLRQPGIEDSRFGLGLGIRMVHSAAQNHGGTLLVSRGENGGTQIVMTLAIRQRKQNQLHCPVFSIDYSGGFDHSLVELADVLSSELFDGSF